MFGNLRAQRRIDRARRSGSDFLDLSHLGLTELPETIGTLTNLTALHLWDNQLTGLPETIGNLTNLTTLNLSRNQLTELPETIGNLTNLTDLGLWGNQLTGLPETIGNLTNLTYLNLWRNQLTELPETIGNLTNLTILYLDGNRLTGLPETIGNLTNLTTLDLKRNPGLVSPPPAVVAEGTAAVLAFLRARRGEQRVQWRSKLLIVGQGGTGKTSLVKALEGAEHNPDEPTTHGLRISELLFDHRSGTAWTCGWRCGTSAGRRSTTPPTSSS